MGKVMRNFPKYLNGKKFDCLKIRKFINACFLKIVTGFGLLIKHYCDLDPPGLVCVNDASGSVVEKCCKKRLTSILNIEHFKNCFFKI